MPRRQKQHVALFLDADQPAVDRHGIVPDPEGRITVASAGTDDGAAGHIRADAAHFRAGSDARGVQHRRGEFAQERHVIGLEKRFRRGHEPPSSRYQHKSNDTHHTGPPWARL